MQYTVTRAPGGQLLGDMLVVLDVTGGRDALVRSIGQVETETQYLLEPQASGTRLTLANRCFRPVPEARQNLLRDSTVEFAGRYKTLIEESGGQRRRCPRPRHDQAKGLRRRMSVPGGAAAAPLMSKATARTRWAISLMATEERSGAEGVTASWPPSDLHAGHIIPAHEPCPLMDGSQVRQ
jgi:hypothetical protein